MNEKEHIERHKILHACLDELLADFITHTSKLPSKTTILELASWSHQQTIKPDEDKNEHNL